MKPLRKAQRILVATPELSFLPGSMGSDSQKISARAGGLGDAAATLVQSLVELGADVHVAIPNYRRIFRGNPGPAPTGAFGRWSFELPHERVHLVQDRAFFHLPKLFPGNGRDNLKVALAFQREIINRVVPLVQPDLIHCYDWMTGLIPAVAREQGIPCLFTLHSLNTARLTLGAVEEQGIDAASFWQRCYYARMPVSYEETRDNNPLDLLVSAVFAAHFVTTPSTAFLKQITAEGCDFVDPALNSELRNKYRTGCLAAIAHAPPPQFDPATDRALCSRYGPETHAAAKAANKRRLQALLRLREDGRAPLFFWPTRLDRERRGCALMAEILPSLMRRYEHQGLQVIFAADGDMHDDFRALARNLSADDRVAVCDFNHRLYRRAFAAADFVLMPMQHEPCGLACRIALRYGTLPIGHDTGGIHDTLVQLDGAGSRGNGFVFSCFDAPGLSRAVEQALRFYHLPDSVRAGHIARIMKESRHGDSLQTARQYIDLYERLLQHPFEGLRAGKRPPAFLKAAA